MYNSGNRGHVIRVTSLQICRQQCQEIGQIIIRKHKPVCMHTLTHRLYRYETIITYIDLNKVQFTIIYLYNTHNSEV